MGEGLNDLYSRKDIELISTDVALIKETDVVCDCHDLPFDEGTFDCVIVQAVLEHVLDPFRCVNEIYRVSKLGAIVYAETPFMQQVHYRIYDFTRFTHLGHRTAVVSVGGIGTNAGANYIHTQGSSTTNWRVTHSLSEQYPNVTIYDSNNDVIIPQTVNSRSSYC